MRRTVQTPDGPAEIASHEMPDADVLCRAVPRGEADASPMSRGPFPAAPKAEG